MTSTIANQQDEVAALIALYTAFYVSLATWLIKSFVDEIPVEVEEAARLAGVNVLGVIIFVYAMTGMLVGLAAVIQLGQSGTVQPNAGLGLELQVIAATVIGVSSGL